MLLKNRYLLRVLPMVAALLFIGACAEEELLRPEPIEPEEYGYFTISVVFADDGTPSSRAFDGGNTEQAGDYFFNTGLEAESRISSDPGANWLLAYDANGGLVSKMPLGKFVPDETTEIGISKSYKAVCQISGGGQSFVSQVSDLRIILNANSNLQDKIEKESAQFSEVTIGKNDLFLTTTEAGNDIRYNTMSSSMIVKDEKAEAAVTKSSMQLYPTEEEALKNPCATLYVERLQAKYTVLFRPRSNGDEFYFENNEIKRYTTSTTEGGGSADNQLIEPITFQPTSSTTARRVYYVDEFNPNDTSPTVRNDTWKVCIVGWGVNGTEPEEYLFKNFGLSPDTYKDWNFTSTTPIRNLWAVDPHYADGPQTYPDQYRGANDVSTSTTFKQLHPYNKDEHPLTYLSFDDLKQREIRQYSSENTYDADSVYEGDDDNSTTPAQKLERRLQYRCGNHIVIGAQLLIQGMDTDAAYNPTALNDKGLVEGVTSKYFMDNIYWAENAYINYYIKELSSYLNATTQCLSDLTPKNQAAFIPNNVFSPAEGETKFYVRENSGYRVAEARDFTIEPAEIIGGDGWCYPFPKKETGNESNTILYVKQSNGTYKQITVDEYEKFAYGYPFYFAKCYNEGRMYYAVPISTNDTNRQQAGDFGLVTGDYGAVRNHWYHYRFTGLTSVGVPVHDPEQPIIPNNEPSVLGLGFEVMIIPWHVVDEDVDI